MTLKERINDDIKVAMRSGDAIKRDVLRMASSALQYAEIEKGNPLNPDEELVSIRRQARQRKESIEAFRSGGREESARQEEVELAILEEYLPHQKDREEIIEIVSESILVVKALGVSDKGKVIANVMSQYKAEVDGSLVNEVVMELLNKI
jgi:uncharacterized protein YqeY